MVIPLLRVMCNAINTSTRWRHLGEGNLIQDCPWCGGLGDDNILHLGSCTKLRASILTHWPGLQLPTNNKQAVDYYCLVDRPDKEEILRRVVVADLCVKAYNSRYKGDLRVSPYFLGNMLEARVRFWKAGDRKRRVAKIFAELYGPSQHYIN